MSTTGRAAAALALAMVLAAPTTTIELDTSIVPHYPPTSTPPHLHNKSTSLFWTIHEVGRNARVDATIEPGNVQEVVSVVADAPLVETNSPPRSRARSGRTKC